MQGKVYFFYFYKQLTPDLLALQLLHIAYDWRVVNGATQISFVANGMKWLQYAELYSLKFRQIHWFKKNTFFKHLRILKQFQILFDLETGFTLLNFIKQWPDLCTLIILKFIDTCSVTIGELVKMFSLDLCWHSYIFWAKNQLHF